MFNSRYRLQNTSLTEIDEMIECYGEYLPLEKVTCVVPQLEHMMTIQSVTCT